MVREGDKRAHDEYVALVREIGFGFHPDTPADGYDPPLPPELRARYERVVSNAFSALDPYEVGVRTFEEMEKEMERIPR